MLKICEYRATNKNIYHSSVFFQFISSSVKLVAARSDTKLPRQRASGAIFTTHAELRWRTRVVERFKPRRASKNTTTVGGNRYYEASLMPRRGSSSPANKRTWREMAEDEEADCPNNARLFRIAVSNSLKNIAESVRWVTLALEACCLSRATSRAQLNLFYPLLLVRFFCLIRSRWAESRCIVDISLIFLKKHVTRPE